MRKIYLYIAILFLQASSISCNKDFLNDAPGNVLPRETYVIDTRSAQEYLIGIYALMAKDVYVYIAQLYPELIADNIKPLSGVAVMIPSYNWQQIADEVNNSNNNVNLISYNGYKVILACNFLLSRSEMFRKDNVERANDITGQAYAIRAMIHYMLVNTYAQAYNFTPDAQHPGIAYVKTEDWAQASGKRLSVAEVYKNIMADYTEAIRLLPEVKTSSFVINKYTAMALMARACLAKEDYTSARNLARRVIEKTPLMTTNYPDKLYTAQDAEALLQLAPDETFFITSFAGIYFRKPLYFVAARDLALMLQENTKDSRYKWITMTKSGNDTLWTITKFPSGAIAGITNLGGAYYPDVIRSSELYLIAAESYARSSATIEDSARYFLNMIRSRANTTAMPVTVSGNSLLDSIYKERRKELAFEGFRMPDLLRWKKGVVRSDPSSASVKTLPYPSPFAIAPIPVLDIKLSGSTQNDEY